ncbi:hypothetical protein LINPERHAP2_LOCUS34495 [Linum perenne]
MFGFVLQIGALVREKELKLRQAMSTMGFYESTYWLSWIAWEGILRFISAAAVVARSLYLATLLELAPWIHSLSLSVPRSGFAYDMPILQGLCMDPISRRKIWDTMLEASKAMPSF